MVFDRRFILTQTAKTARGVTFSALALAAGAVTLQPAHAEEPAVAAVRQFQDGQQAILPKLSEMTVQQRYDALRGPIGATFDLLGLARLLYGPGWDALTEAQKAEWSTALGDYLAASYAARLDGFNGKSFERDDKTIPRDGAMVVTSRVILTSGGSMPLDYVVRETPQGWRIGDILANGSISELAQWRKSLRGLGADYATSLKTLRERAKSFLAP